MAAICHGAGNQGAGTWKLMKYKIADAVTDKWNQVANAVLEKGTNGSVTDVNGVYAIIVNDASSVLVFNFIGYTARK
jgi:hypothetical protein